MFDSLVKIEDFTEKGLTVEIAFNSFSNDLYDWEIVKINEKVAFNIEIQQIYARMEARDFQRFYAAIEGLSYA